MLIPSILVSAMFVIHGVVSACPAGHTEVDFVCVDIDECMLGNGGCPQVCVNTIGSFYCSCTNSAHLVDSNNTCVVRSSECLSGCSYSHVSVQCFLMLVDDETWSKLLDSKCFEVNSPIGLTLLLIIYPSNIGRVLTVTLDFITKKNFSELRLQTLFVLDCSLLGINKVALSSNGTALTGVSTLAIIGCFEQSSVLNFTKYFPFVTSIYLHGIITESRTLVGFWDSFRNLTEIRLHQNRLNTLEANMFQNISNIQTINLDGNFIGSLQNDTFSHLSSLRIIQLNVNSIKTIHDFQFTNMRSLEVVELQRNSLTSLPSTAFEQCPMLREIDVSINPFNCTCDLSWTNTVRNSYAIDFGSAACSSTGMSILSSSNYPSCPADKQECFNASILCEFACVNTLASFYCVCPEGYGLTVGNLIDCDVDECKFNICNQTCTNTVGSYYCGCMDGFKLNTDNSSCDEIDECSSGNSSCLQTCINTVGSYYCECRTGFLLNSDNRSCDDINECDSSVCIAGCTNTIGSYKCRCSVENPLLCCPVNQSYCPDTGCCLDNVYPCPPNFPTYVPTLTVTVSNEINSPLVLTVRSFPTTVLCSINPDISSDYTQGFIEICEIDWENCRTELASHSSNFIYFIFDPSSTFSFARCRYQTLTAMSLERNFIVTPHTAASFILSQISANNVLSLLAWNVSSNCSLNCPRVTVDVFSQSYPGISLLDSISFEISCSVYASLHWFSYSSYKINLPEYKINFPEYFGDDYSIQIANSVFGAITRDVSIPFPLNLYCSADFRYGVFWGVTLVGETARLNCSSLLPEGSSELGLSRFCGENGGWSDVISECSFPAQSSKSVVRAVLSLSLQQYISPSMNTFCPNSLTLVEYFHSRLNSPVLSAVREQYTDTIVVTGSSRESLIGLLDNLTALDCYSRYWVSEIVLNASFCQCRNGMESDRVFVCTEQACSCTGAGCVCSPGFAGNGVYCSPDRDGDNFPSVGLPCSDSACRMDNCDRSNPAQEDCNLDGIGDACQELCPPENDATFGLAWPCSLKGENATVPCGETGQLATRFCVGHKLWSALINTQDCASPSYAGLTILSSADSLRELSLLVNKEMPTYSGDIEISVRVLRTNQNRTESRNLTELNTVLDDILNIVDRLIDFEVIELLGQTESISPVTEDIIRVLEGHALNVLSQNQSVRFDNLPNIHFETQFIERTDKPITLGADTLQFETTEGMHSVQVTVPTDQFDSGGISVNVFVVRNLGTILSHYSSQISFDSVPITYFDLSGSKIEIVSPLVSVHIMNGGTKITSFKDKAVSIRIPFNVMVPAESYRRLTCVFIPLETAEADSGSHSTWMDTGLEYNLSTNSLVHCFSTHLTSFAVLASVNGLEQQNPPLTILSYIGVGLSIVSLSLCIFIYLVFGHKLLMNLQHYTYFNLIMSLLLLFILFSVGLELPYRDNFGAYLPCKIASGLLQFLLLCVFAWMLLVGIIILILMLWPFYQFTKVFALISTLLCWTLPALYVGSYTYFVHDSFLTPTNLALPGYCWIQSHDGLRNAHRHNLLVIIPISCVILFNIGIFILVTVKALKVFYDKKSFRKLERSRKVSLSLLRLFIVLTPLLGFLWIVGLLTLDPVSAFAWVFTILGSFQGLFVLVFVVLLRKDIRDAIVGRFDTLYRRVTSITGQQESKLTM